MKTAFFSLATVGVFLLTACEAPTPQAPEASEPQSTQAATKLSNQAFVCTKSASIGGTGFVNDAAAAGWTPEVINLKLGSAMTFEYFDAKFEDSAPKISGAEILGKDQIGIRTRTGESFGIAVKATFNTSDKTLKLRNSSRKTGYKTAIFGANYNCQ